MDIGKVKAKALAVACSLNYGVWGSCFFDSELVILQYGIKLFNFFEMAIVLIFNLMNLLVDFLEVMGMVI